jgi:hypothetical protein
MTEPNSNVLRSVAWAELFPWLNIFKTFRLAIGFRALVLSTVAAIITASGWGLLGLDMTCNHSVAVAKSGAQCPVRAMLRMVPDTPDMLGASPAMPPKDAGPALGEEEVKAFTAKTAKYDPYTSHYEPLTDSWMYLNRPLLEGIGLEVTFGHTLRLIACGLWALAVWAFFGAAITRIAAVQLAANERITLGAALRYACAKFFAYFFAPLFPLGGIALAVLPVLIAGWLLRIGVIAFFVGLFWPIYLVCGLIITLLLLGLVFGWPLMWPTISTEKSDSFDALSRSYAYVFQRPLHYMFYVLVAAVLGVLGWLLVKNFASTIIYATYWSASWGAGAGRTEELMNYKDLTGMGYAGAWLIHAWSAVVKLLAVGFTFSYFWNAMTAIYLLLRRNVDATEMDEVELDADEGEAKFGLPKIVLDDAGAPEVEKAPVPQEQAPEASPPAATGDTGSTPPPG